MKIPTYGDILAGVCGVAFATNSSSFPCFFDTSVKIRLVYGTLCSSNGVGRQADDLLRVLQRPRDESIMRDDFVDAKEDQIFGCAAGIDGTRRTIRIDPLLPLQISCRL